MQDGGPGPAPPALLSRATFLHPVSSSDHGSVWTDCSAQASTAQEQGLRVKGQRKKKYFSKPGDKK